MWQKALLLVGEGSFHIVFASHAGIKLVIERIAFHTCLERPDAELAFVAFKMFRLFALARIIVAVAVAVAYAREEYAAPTQFPDEPHLEIVFMVFEERGIVAVEE